MPIRADLLAEIRSALGSAISPGVTSRSAACDVYEAYVFSMILRAAQIEGATTRFESRSGAVPTTFVFRSSPGYLYSERKDYSHAVIEFPNAPALELHISVRVSGVSKVLHECDIAVIDRNEALTCRANRVSPRNTKIPLTVECKFYASGLPLDLARSFVGLTKELGAKNRFLVYNTEAASIEQMLGHYDHKWEHHIVPSSSTEVDRLRNAFQTVFKNYKATSRRI